VGLFPIIFIREIFPFFDIFRHGKFLIMKSGIPLKILSLFIKSIDNKILH